MKKIVIDLPESSWMQAVRDVIAQSQSENNGRITLSFYRMNHESVIKSIDNGKLQDMDNDMKISKSSFYRGFVNMTEIIIQVTPEKVALFSDF